MRMDGQEPGKAPEIFGIAAMLMGRDRAQLRPARRRDPLGKKKIFSERLRKPSS
jgi:hypothetical protein